MACTCAFSAPPARSEDGAARLGELERRLRVLVEEDFFHGRPVGCVGSDYCADGFAQVIQPLGHGRPGSGCYLAVGDMREPRPFRPHQAPAGAGQRGIESEDEGHSLRPNFGPKCIINR